MLSTHWVMTDNVAKKWARIDRRSPDHAMGCNDRHSCSDEIHCQCHICWFRWPPWQIPPCRYPARWVKPPWQPWQGARGGSSVGSESEPQPKSKRFHELEIEIDSLKPGGATSKEKTMISIFQLELQQLSFEQLRVLGIEWLSIRATLQAGQTWLLVKWASLHQGLGATWW